MSGAACTRACTHLQPFETKRGDRMERSRDEAIKRANRRALKRGVRQSVKRHTGSILRGIWVIQDVR